MEVHEGRKNHMCNECGKCFARPDKLRDHEKIHLSTGNGNRGRNKKIVKEEPEEEDSDGLMKLMKMTKMQLKSLSVSFIAYFVYTMICIMK